MKGKFRFVNPDLDPSHAGYVLFDMNKLGNDWGVIPNPSGVGLLGDLDLGTSAAQTDYLDSAGTGYGGEQPSKTRRPNVEMNFNLWAFAETYQQMLTFAEQLALNLTRQGVIEWQPEGQILPRYIDYYPSSVSSFLHGQALATNKIIHLLMESDGLPVTIVRHPFLRGPVITHLDNADLQDTSVTSGPTGRDMIFSVPGSVPALAKIVVTPNEGAAKTVEVQIGRRSIGHLTEFTDHCGFQVENANLYNGTDVEIGISDASGNSAARTDFGTVAGLARRWRKLIAPTDPTATLGRFKVFAVVEADPIAGRNPGKIKVQCRWNEGNANPAEAANEVVVLDFTDIEQFHFVPINLGTIEIVSGGSFVLEGWAGWESGDDDNDLVGAKLRWDQVFLMPVDEANTKVSVPGHKQGGSNLTRYQGDDLKEQGATASKKNDDVVLNSQGDSAYTPGYQLSTGRHKVSCRVSLKNPNRKRQLMGYLRLEKKNNLGQWVTVNSNTGDEDGSAPIRVPIRSGKNLWTNRKKSLQFDASTNSADNVNTTSEYRFVVEFANDPTSDGTAKINVHSMTHRYHRYSTPTSPMRIDGQKRQARLYEGNDPVATLSLTGGFMYLAPGDNLLLFNLGDAPKHGYDDVDDREPLARATANRTATVRIEVTPRYLA